MPCNRTGAPHWCLCTEGGGCKAWAADLGHTHVSEDHGPPRLWIDPFQIRRRPSTSQTPVRPLSHPVKSNMHIPREIWQVAKLVIANIRNWCLLHRWLFEPTWRKQWRQCCTACKIPQLSRNTMVTVLVVFDEGGHGFQVGSSVVAHSNGLRSAWLTLHSGTTLLRKTAHMWLLHFVSRMYACKQQNTSLAFSSTTPRRRWTWAQNRCASWRQRSVKPQSHLGCPSNRTTQLYVVPPMRWNRGCITDLGPRGPHPSLQLYPTAFPARILKILSVRQRCLRMTYGQNIAKSWSTPSWVWPTMMNKSSSQCRTSPRPRVGCRRRLHTDSWFAPLCCPLGGLSSPGTVGPGPCKAQTLRLTTGTEPPHWHCCREALSPGQCRSLCTIHAQAHQ